MNVVRTLSSALPLVLALFVAGCSAEAAPEEAGSSEDAVSTTQPITLANYVSHPTIKAIRAEVARIDALELAQTERIDCHGYAKKWEASGKVHKVQLGGGEGGFEGQQTAYFRANGKLLFVHGTDTDFTESEKGLTSERRVYFDAAGKIVFQTFRDSAGKDSIPTGDEAFSVGDVDTSEEWYTTTSCGTWDGTEEGANANK